jgi:ABC-2 type transport system permease protein
MLYAFLGLPYATDAGVAAALLGSWSTFALVGVVFFMFAVTLAQERASHWSDTLAVLPDARAAHVLARLIVAAGFSILAVGAVVVTALVASPAELGATGWARFLVVLGAGAVPIALLGYATGRLAGAEAAVAVATLVHLPLSYLGGLWLLPDRLQGLAARVSPYVPTRPLGDLARAATTGQPWAIGDWAALGAWSLGLGLVAVVLTRRSI